MKVSGKVSNPSMPSAEAAKSAKTSGPEALLDSKKAKAAGAGAPGSARVELSARAQEMAKAKELATPSNDIDEAKVARLQKLIDAGEYRVDAEAVADRLLDEQMKMPT